MRKLKKSKKYVLVACEGPSEEEYIKYFKKKFNSVADIYPIVITGSKLFPELMRTLTGTSRKSCNIETHNYLFLNELFQLYTKLSITLSAYLQTYLRRKLSSYIRGK